jgi:transposase
VRCSVSSTRGGSTSSRQAREGKPRARLCQLVLANPAQIKGINRPKTDVCDARWIADLLAHGLIRGSFVPEQPIQELRALTRTRKQLVQEQTRHVQRIQKTLEDANLKLDGVLANIVGTSGKAMLRALITGETDPQKLATLAHPRVKASQEQLAAALQGRVTAHHRFLLDLHLDQVERLEVAVDTLDKEVGAALEPFREDIRRLKTIPWVSDVTAALILAEVGADMACFPTPQHLVSWAHLCPRNDESAGKRQSTRVAEPMGCTMEPCDHLAKAITLTRRYKNSCPSYSDVTPSRSSLPCARTSSMSPKSPEAPYMGIPARRR